MSQELIPFDSQAKFGPLRLSVNKVVLAHSHTSVYW